MEWKNAGGFSLMDSQITERDISLTFRYKGPCQEASGDLKYARRIDGRVVADDELFGAGITRDLPPVQRDHQRVVTNRLPRPLARIEGVIVRLVESGCGQIDPVG